MKGLLHSKKFKSNLYKWLFMYVGVMLLLTAVITYSKYISNLGGKDEARVASFDVRFEHDDLNCTNDVCSVGAYRPTSEMVEYVAIDLGGLEVTTDLELTISVNDPFKMVSIEEEGDKKFGACESKIEGENSRSFCGRIQASDTSIVRFKVEAMYPGETYQFVSPKDETGQNLSFELITVGYSAAQVTK